MAKPTRARARSGAEGGRELSRTTLAIAAALGGAALTFAVNYGLDNLKHQRDLTEAQQKQRLATEAERRGATLRMHEQYRALGDVPLRASRFVDDGSAGSADDVRKLWLHFRDLSSALVLGVLDENVARTAYGGDLVSLAGRFASLANHSSPRWRSFQPYELEDYGRLATALLALANRRSQPGQATPGTDASSPADGGRTPGSNRAEPDLNAALDKVVYTGNSVGRTEYNEEELNLMLTNIPNTPSDEPPPP